MSNPCSAFWDALVSAARANPAPSESATAQAETAAEAQGTTNDPEVDTQGCRGWIEAFTHYQDFSHIAVSGRVTLSRITNGAATQIEQHQVDYTTIAASDTVFVAPRPTAGGGPAMPANQSQAPAVAAANGNPHILLGGDAGLEIGTYRVDFQPTIAHGKLRVHPTPITTAESADHAEGYKIIPTDGTVPTAFTAATTTDEYLQVPMTTAVETEWSQDITVVCGDRTAPQKAEFSWTDFRADPHQNDRCTNNLRTLHPELRHKFFAFINTAEDIDRVYTVTDAFRTPAEQDILYCNSRATSSYCVNLGYTNGSGAWRSNAKRWQSNHNYGLAVDMYNLTTGQLVAVAAAGGDLAPRFGLHWGISFGDTPHFENVDPDEDTLEPRRHDAANLFTYDGREYVSFP